MALVQRPKSRLLVSLEVLSLLKQRELGEVMIECESEGGWLERLLGFYRQAEVLAKCSLDA